MAMFVQIWSHKSTGLTEVLLLLEGLLKGKRGNNVSVRTISNPVTPCKRWSNYCEGSMESREELHAAL